MKRFFLLAAIFILLINSAYAATFFMNPENDKSITFVSKYESSSMDPDTFEYYKRLKEDYSIYIVKDEDVINEEAGWIDARDNSDLVFVMTVSDSALRGDRNNFCKGLSKTLNLTKGIVFAGNSLIFDNMSIGCVYTSHFNFADQANNTNMGSVDEVRVTKDHEISKGYELGDYNLTPGRIYTVPNIKGEMTIGKARGNPDGPGPIESGRHPFLSVWQGLTYRAAIWGIDEYSVVCDGCLGWDLFDQMIEWTSKKEGMGFNITTDKEAYRPGEEITVYINSEVEMASVTGNLTLPDSSIKALYFTGSGKSWQSVYLLDDDDPLGNVTININSGGFHSSKVVELRLIDIEIGIENVTETVKIDITIKDIDGSTVSHVETKAKILAPGGNLTEYTSSSGNFVIYYNVSQTGKHRLAVEANYSNRIIIENTEFIGKLKSNISSSPKNFTMKLGEPVNITQEFTIENQGSENITNIVINFDGNIKDIVNPDKIVVESLGPRENKSIEFNLTIPKEQGTYSGTIIVDYSDDFIEIPIKIELKYPGMVGINPESADFSILKGEKKVLEFNIENTGLGEVKITRISLTGDVETWGEITEKPRVISPGNIGVIKVLFDSTGFYSGSLMEDISGSMVIETEDETKTVGISMKIVGDLIGKLDSFYGDFQRAEGDIQELEKSSNVDDLYSKLDALRSDVQSARSDYERGYYEQAKLTIDNIEAGLTELTNSIEQKRVDIENKRESTTTMAIVVSVLVAGGIIGYLFYRKRSEERKFKWVYKKWAKK